MEERRLVILFGARSEDKEAEVWLRNKDAEMLGPSMLNLRHFATQIDALAPRTGVPKASFELRLVRLPNLCSYSAQYARLRQRDQRGNHRIQACTRDKTDRDETSKTLWKRPEGYA
eukprot:2934722-Pleurochrysis_carterae.AAC.3